jgi:hypothetical protein
MQFLLGTRGDMARRPGQSWFATCRRRNCMPEFDDLRLQSDDLRVRYEELLRLRAELERWQPRNKQVPPKKPR